MWDWRIIKLILILKIIFINDVIRYSHWHGIISCYFVCKVSFPYLTSEYGLIFCVFCVWYGFFSHVMKHHIKSVSSKDYSIVILLFWCVPQWVNRALTGHVTLFLWWNCYVLLSWHAADPKTDPNTPCLSLVAYRSVSFRLKH